jgi:hypothetical protein
MTTIVYKNGVLAADSLVCYGDKRYGLATKIFETSENIFGGAGCLMHNTFFQKFINGEDIDKELFKSISESGFDGIVINKKTKEVTIYDQFLTPENVNAEFYCLGSGADIARGALSMGATPREAIECASKYDLYTNNDIQELII